MPEETGVEPETFVRLSTITITRVLGDDGELFLMTETSDDLHPWDILGMLAVVLEQEKRGIGNGHEDDYD